MAVYKIINLIGESEKSFSDAVNNAVHKAAQTVKQIKYSEIVRFSTKIENGKVTLYQAEVRLSFQLENETQI
jgi:flavin-binding protein dodecin